MAEDWFDYRKARQAERICANCPMRKACARAALDLNAADGVWEASISPARTCR